MNNFILSYNPFNVSPSSGQILNHIQVNRDIIGYYQPFAGTYILKSEQTAAFLTERIKGLFEAAPFMLTQLFPTVVGGTLPQDAWHWINHGYVPPPAPPAPPSLLSGLLARGGLP